MENGTRLIASFFLRAAIGMMIIFMTNEVFAINEMEIVVGLNPVSFLVSGMFGIPGVALLYGIGLY